MGVIERLLLETCRSKLVLAIKADGQAAVEEAAAGLMEAALGGLYSDTAAEKALDGLETHYDRKKWADFGVELMAALKQAR